MFLQGLFGYQDHRHEYFGCISIRHMIYVAILLIITTQCYASIFMLTYHDWWWFFGLFTTLPAIVILVLAIRVRHRYGIIGFIVYQCLFIILLLSTFVWLFVVLCEPSNYSISPFYYHCQKTYGSLVDTNIYKRCTNYVRTTAGINIAVFFFLTLINIFCLHVVLNYLKYLQDCSSGRRTMAASLRRNAPQGAQTVVTVSQDRPAGTPATPTAQQYPAGTLPTTTAAAPVASPSPAYTTPYSPYQPQPLSAVSSPAPPLPKAQKPMLPPDELFPPSAPSKLSAPPAYTSSVYTPPAPSTSPYIPPRPEQYDLPPATGGTDGTGAEVGDKYDFPPETGGW